MGKGPERLGSSTEAEICSPDWLHPEATALTRTSCKQLVNNLVGTVYVTERSRASSGANSTLYRVVFLPKSSSILAGWVQPHSEQSQFRRPRSLEAEGLNEPTDYFFLISRVLFYSGKKTWVRAARCHSCTWAQQKGDRVPARKNTQFQHLPGK